METTDSGISFSLVKKPTGEKTPPINHDGKKRKGKKTNAQLEGQSLSKVDKPEKVASDQNKSESDLSTPNLRASGADRKKKGKGKASEENISTPKLLSNRKGKNKEENSSTPKMHSSREEKAIWTPPNLVKQKISRKEGNNDKVSNDALASEDVGQSSSAAGASKERSSSGRGKQGLALRNRKIKASHSEGELVKEGVKALYKHHYSLQRVEEELEAKSLFQGTLRINKRNRSESYVTVPGRDEDIFIQGVVARNRALNGDIVVIEILLGEEHAKEIEKLKQNRQEKLNKEQERLEKVAIVDDQEDIMIEDIMENEVDEELEDSGITNISVENISFGRVVYIMARTFNHNVAGTLQIENFGAQDPKKVWFKPVDKRMPFFVVSREIAPKEFLESPADFDRTFFTASIIKWSAQSRLPLAQVTGKLGQMGELPIETQALLADAGVTWNDFDDSVLIDLPATPWEIPQSEVANRRDFRNEHVFSIDPLTAKDLDDAISVKYLDNGLMEVGVHIADVSHFVKPKTNLDKEAYFRATTVYLVQRAIPMLPRLLCEQLCSLNPDVDRLAFSVVWVMNPNAEIVGEPWFGKSIIRSRAKLAYEHAQAIIEARDWSNLPKVTMSKDTTFDAIKRDVLTFYNLSKHLRRKRYDNGALSIQSIKLWFALDDLGNPTKTGIYQIKDSNRLIEEFMLLANMAVAQKISSVFPEASLLRCHPPPLQKALDRFLELAKKIGYEFDASSAGSLHKSFDDIQDPIIRHTWRLLSIKVMKRAVYFNTGTQELNGFKHYALSVPLYTHFTSPIRRYADLVVHRILHSILQEQENPYISSDVVEIAKQCNIRKETAKTAQDASMNLYLISLLHNISKIEDLCEFAIVTEVGNRSVDVIVPRFGIEKRVWIEDLIAENSAIGCQLDSKTITLKVHWKKVNPPLTLVQSKMEQIKLDDQNKSLVVIAEDDNGDNWEDIKEGQTPPEVLIQSIRMFDTIKVRIKPLLERSPPTLQLLLAFPTEKYSTNDIFSVVEDIFIFKSKSDNATLQSAASCPGMADDRD